MALSFPHVARGWASLSVRALGFVSDRGQAHKELIWEPPCSFSKLLHHLGFPRLDLKT